MRGYASFSMYSGKYLQGICKFVKFSDIPCLKLAPYKHFEKEDPALSTVDDSVIDCHFKSLAQKEQ